MSYGASPLDFNAHLQQFSLQQQTRSPSASSPASPSSTTSTRRPHRAGANARSRVSKACQRCRIRKVKCDGGKPCVRCIEVDDICDYTRLSRNRDVKEYSQSYVDQLLDQNSKYKTAMRLLYANRRLSIHPDDMTLPSTEEKDVPLVHDILDSLGLLKESEVSKEVDGSEADLDKIQCWSNADTVSSSADSTTWARNFDFGADQTPTGPFAPSSSANRDIENYDVNFGCRNGFFDPSVLNNFSMGAEQFQEDLSFENLDFEMGPSVSFEDLEAVGSLINQNQFMEGMLTQQNGAPNEMFTIWT